MSTALIFSTIKSCIETIKTANEFSRQTDVALAIKKFNEEILNLQTQYQKLMDENDILKKEILNHNQWDNISSKYKIKEIPIGKWVYAKDDGTRPYICEKCFGDKRLSPLHENLGYYKCNCCKNELFINKDRTVSLFRC
jgi:hypothetical protein